MTDNEKLIESVRDIPTITRMSHVSQIEKIGELRDALVAAEKAHIPSDDEREVMRRIIAEGSYSRSRDDLPYQDVADRLVAAGFGSRHPEVPEPNAEPNPITLEDLSETSTSLKDLVGEARSEAAWCCDNGCGSGACETCPCCSAGYCVSGFDGVPDDPEDREHWLEVAAEYNPVAAALRAVESGAAARALAVHDAWGTPNDPEGKIRPLSDYTNLSARMAQELRKGNGHV